jgi:hypothetical protein
MTLQDATERARDIWGPSAVATPWPALDTEAATDFWIRTPFDPEVHRLDAEGRVTCNHALCWFYEEQVDRSGEDWGV